MLVTAFLSLLFYMDFFKSDVLMIRLICKCLAGFVTENLQCHMKKSNQIMMWPQFLPSKPKEKQTTNIKFFTLIEIFQIPHDHLISSNRSLIFWVTWEIILMLPPPLFHVGKTPWFFSPSTATTTVRQVWSGPGPGPCATSSAKGYLRHLDNERLKGGADCDVGWVETYRYTNKDPTKASQKIIQTSSRVFFW